MALKNTSSKKTKSNTRASIPLSKEELIRDLTLAIESRQASLLGRREVLSGKAKFGIFGDGKELPQLAWAHAFKKGDFRSGYYRDQTFMFALGMSSVKEFFAQLYAIPDTVLEPASAGRSMNGHFATRSLNVDGTWLNLKDQYNSSADISPTGSQMPRLVGLAYASRLYRSIDVLKSEQQFSNNGNEVAWGTIGNASAAEGMFWESVNAIGVLKSPAVISIWDDGYGISVPNEFQMTKSNVGELLSGFQRKPGTKDGYDVHTVKAWDYPALLEVYQNAGQTARTEHVPQIIHVIEVTQPQGHSTSGSHERYKSKERLQWEQDFDGIARMKQWLVKEGLITDTEIEIIEQEATIRVKEWRDHAWKAYQEPILQDLQEATKHIEHLINECVDAGICAELEQLLSSLKGLREPFRRDIMGIVHRVLLATAGLTIPSRTALLNWKASLNAIQQVRYSSHLFSESANAISGIAHVPAHYDAQPMMVNGSEIMNACFDYHLNKDHRIVAFGEDVGQLGDVNQGFSGLQAKYGTLRVSDTGIREATILGQGIGLAMRGLKPIIEIQYLDYLLYALQLMSDDLATVQWRTKGGQKAPAIIRTRGHRLEGVWHSGSPMAGIINLVRGIHVCVPRNMTQAAGMYATLLQSDEPGLIIEVLNGYRLKEALPSNMGEYTVPLGLPEILRQGSDITLVTYGACCRIALDAAEQLAKLNIQVEVIDVQTLLPFDLSGTIVHSLKKTNRILFFDEDVPGGTTAYMMQEVLEKQRGYSYLDSQPATLASKEHRPAYGTDGNFWSKAEAEHVVEAIYAIMHEANPLKHPHIF
ncbi:MAG: thiamine pyrophosphate-dependent enzyme [Ignavibacteria bacterium]|jgi:pyruvate/2-oxoglutarate/acetoin dehydrogenase E1 component/TPP-dependent pyruvate/acetoin dehydrogenase alpha subunit